VDLNQNENQLTAAVLLCAGSSSRMKGIDKPTSVIDGIPIFVKSLKKFNNSNLFSKIIVVASDDNISTIKKILKDYSLDGEVMLGGERRQDSVSIAIDHLAKFSIEKVAIHDAARPLFLDSILVKGIRLLNENDAIIPVIPIQDTVKKVKLDQVIKTINRDELFRSQTPQFFNFEILKKCILKTSKKMIYTDESELLEINGFKVKCIEGNIENQKITTPDDIKFLKIFNSDSNFKTGVAADVHRLVKGDTLVLGGIKIPYNKRLDGHSDADVVLHAVSDSIFGAIGHGDLGKHFPSNQKKWKNVSSEIFLKKAIELMNELNLEIFHIDIQIIIEQPKLSNLLVKIEKNISNLLNLDIEKINLKVTSTDNMGLIGSGDAIGTLCAVTLKETND
tara:strand:+ start:12568 stop:13743 length:1176 start_codon:yes stop_codon:yes gene_type:complete